MKDRGAADGHPFAGDRSGQGELVGVVLLLAVVVVGTGAVVAFGSTALDDTRRTAEIQRAEHAMTLLDARSAMVAIGDSDVQTVAFAGAHGGSLDTRSDSGWIRVEHVNYTDGGHDEVIYNATIGAIVYENGPTEVAYQGGGVWRKRGNASRMVSPPEFHYRGATLTLPIIRVNGSDAAAGDTRAVVRGGEPRSRVYANGSTTGAPNVGAPYNATGEPYLNPVRNGTINVTVQSEYYQGWASYFRTRTAGNVTVDHPGKRVTVELISIGDLGEFQMPANGNSIELRGISGHVTRDYNITLFADGNDNANFNNLKWSMYADKGSREFEITLRTPSGNDDGDPVAAYVYYSPNNGNDYHGWRNTSAFEIEEGDFDGDGVTDKRIVANFTSQTNLTYADVGGGSSILHFSPIKGSQEFTNPGTFEGHADWEPENYDAGAGDEETWRNVTGHYFGELGPNFDLTVRDFAGDAISEEDSSGFIEIDGGGQRYVTFLHVSDNEIRVEFE